MTSHRVLLICASRLLGEGLAYLLRDAEDVKLIGPWVWDDFSLASVSDVAPNVVIIAEDDDVYERTTTLIIHLLQAHPELFVFHIALCRATVRVYSIRTLPARSDDLIEAIRSLVDPASWSQVQKTPFSQRR